VDVYYVHWPDSTVPLDETWAAMADLADAGLCRWIGLSNFPRGAVRECHEARVVDAVQIQGSMLYTDELDDIGLWCAEHGIGVMSFGPLAYGLLPGAVDATSPLDDWRGGERGMDDFFVEENYHRFFAPGPRQAHVDAVQRLVPIAESLGLSLAQLALAALLARPEVTGAIAGTRSPAHADANAAAGDVVLDDSIIGAVNAALARPQP
jgi:aryl-alcohol dehydrogenase-like predicted oxidoreductase